MMGYDMQTKFMEESNKDCEILSARGTVHWEWFYNWATTLDTYFPKFVGQNSCLNSFFLTNVPYNFLPPFPDPSSSPPSSEAFELNISWSSKNPP